MIIFIWDLNQLARQEQVNINELFASCIAQGILKWFVLDNKGKYDLLYGESNE